MMADEATAEEIATTEAHLSELEEGLKPAAKETQHGLSGRVEALALALDGARARAGVERLGSIAGVLGTLAQIL